MPPRVRLTAEESARLPSLLARVDELRGSFPSQAEARVQAAWIRERYFADEPAVLNLITLLLFEHGVHRSAAQVRKDLTEDLAILPEESAIE